MLTNVIKDNEVYQHNIFRPRDKKNKDIVESHHKVQTTILALNCNLKMYQEKQVNHKNEKESQS